VRLWIFVAFQSRLGAAKPVSCGPFVNSFCKYSKVSLGTCICSICQEYYHWQTCLSVSNQALFECALASLIQPLLSQFFALAGTVICSACCDFVWCDQVTDTPGHPALYVSRADNLRFEQDAKRPQSSLCHLCHAGHIRVNGPRESDTPSLY